jgi:histidinol-phosphate aminotransferase
VLVVRTFSKAYGLAGLRVGYAVARPDTIARLAPHRLGLAVTALGAAAARAALADRGVAARERRLNAEARTVTVRAFERLGYRVAPSQTNFVMVDVRRDARRFQEACRAHDVLVGRPFPPLVTHARVSIGTLDEMRAAMPVFERVLADLPAARASLPS